MKNKKILFRADSSSAIGIGHIMRDLVLATHYKDAKIYFIVRKLDGNINQKILDAGYNLEIVKSNSINELNVIINKHQAQMLIIDHYDIGYKEEEKLQKKNPKLKLMVLDDTYNRHHCDILLNHNIYAEAKRYKDLVPDKCELRCGKEYTLLRHEFIKAKEKKYKKSSKITIFLAMGGADTSRLNILILEALKNFTNYQVYLVSTSANKNLSKLQKYCKNKPWIKLHINSNKIAKLMAKSHLAIVTPSVILNEVFFMELPFFVIQTAQNQEEMVKYLKKLYI